MLLQPLQPRLNIFPPKPRCLHQPALNRRPATRLVQSYSRSPGYPYTQQPFQLGGTTFSSSKHAWLTLRSILHESPEGTRLEPEEAELVMALLIKHPKAASKIGTGVDYFSVACYQALTGTVSRHFVVHRTDGTSVDFSYIKCFKALNEEAESIISYSNPQYPSDQQSGSGPLHDAASFAYSTGHQGQAHPRWTDRDVALTLKSAAHLIAVSFKQKVFEDAMLSSTTPLCPITQLPLNQDNCFIDHVPPRTFKKMLAAWLKQNSMQLRDIELEETGTGFKVQDDDLLESWNTFYQQHAKLRLISPNGLNLQNMQRAVHSRR